MNIQMPTRASGHIWSLQQDRHRPDVETILPRPFCKQTLKMFPGSLVGSLHSLNNPSLLALSPWCCPWRTEQKTRMFMLTLGKTPHHLQGHRELQLHGQKSSFSQTDQHPAGRQGPKLPKRGRAGGRMPCKRSWSFTSLIFRGFTPLHHVAVSGTVLGCNKARNETQKADGTRVSFQNLPKTTRILPSDVHGSYAQSSCTLEYL